MYKRLFYNLISLSLLFALFPSWVWPGPVLECPELLGTLPPPEAANEFEATVLCNKTLAILYNHNTKTPALVIEHLTEGTMEGPATRKGSRFKPDPRLFGKPQAVSGDFRLSGYDRGHMAPAADFKVDQVAMDQSFLLSNIAPQVGPGFNRSIWRNLEEWVRAKVREKGEFYVFTGPVFYDFTPVIGENRVVVPDAYFKFVYEPESQKAWAFLIPNSAQTSGTFMPFLIPLEVLETTAEIKFNLDYSVDPRD